MREGRQVECWRQVEGYPYEVSNQGRVRRTERAQSTKPGRVLKCRVSPRGYHTVGLWRNNEGKTFDVHTLVAAAFLGPRPEGCEVNHRDGDKTNNSVDNLEYCTPAENRRHAEQNSLLTLGEKNGMTPLTGDDVLEIRRRYRRGDTVNGLAAEFGVSRRTITDVARGRTWGHHRPDTIVRKGDRNG